MFYTMLHTCWRGTEDLHTYNPHTKQIRMNVVICYFFLTELKIVQIYQMFYLTNFIDSCKYMLILNLMPSTSCDRGNKKSSKVLEVACLEHFTGKQVAALQRGDSIMIWISLIYI